MGEGTKQVYVRWMGTRGGEPWMSAPSGPWGAVLDGDVAEFSDADYVELEHKAQGLEDYEGMRELQLYVAAVEAGPLLRFNPMLAVRRETDAGKPAVPIVRVREATMMTMAADEWRRLRRIEAAAVWCLGYLAEAPRKTSTMRDVERKLGEAARERDSQDGAVANG